VPLLKAVRLLSLALVLAPAAAQAVLRGPVPASRKASASAKVPQ
jgi:hypothetical protein